jgi:predicted lipoprotein
MKKYIVISLVFLLFAITVYNSVYFEKLSDKNEKEGIKNFNSKEVVDYFWKNKLDETLKSSIELKSFDSLLTTNPKVLFEQRGKTVGITSNCSFLIKGSAKINGTISEKISIVVADGKMKYNLMTNHLFGNTARDAVGYFKIDDFKNTMDFNAVSTELNSLILKEVITSKIGLMHPGNLINFVGALDVSTRGIQKEFDIVPLRIEILK